jgi:hypothetical protein
MIDNVDLLLTDLLLVPSKPKAKEGLPALIPFAASPTPCLFSFYSLIHPSAYLAIPASQRRYIDSTPLFACLLRALDDGKVVTRILNRRRQRQPPR